MTLLQTFHARLESLAYKITDNFCYSCYKVVRGDYCPDCFSDDFMRHLSGVGVEYGTEWVIEHLISQHCQPVDGNELFEEMLDDCYGEISIGFSIFSPSTVMRECDPTAFSIGADKHLTGLAEDMILYELKGNYYQVSDIENMLDRLEADD